MTGWAKGARNGAAILAVVLLAGCASKTDESLNLEAMEAKDIFALGQEALEGNPRSADAGRYFSEVERLYPYTEWSKRALVMQAYAFHRQKNYEEARSAAQRYLDQFPGEEDAAWAQYLLAISYYDQIDDIGKDQGLTFQALQALRQVIEGYPDSEYARSATLKFDLAFDHLAAKEMEVGRYYLRRGHYTAAVNRFRVVVEQFQTTTNTPEALHRLVESYLALGLTEEAQTAGAILGHNFRSSPFYEDSHKLLTGRGLSAEVRGTGWLQTIYRRAIKGEWL